MGRILEKGKSVPELVSALRGFYVEFSDAAARRRFVDELNLCWLYCSDDVIKRGYEMVVALQDGATNTTEEKRLAVGELVLAIRRDLLNRGLVRKTALEAQDFLHINPGK